MCVCSHLLVAPSAGQAPHRRSSSHLVAVGIAQTCSPCVFLTFNQPLWITGGGGNSTFSTLFAASRRKKKQMLAWEKPGLLRGRSQHLAVGCGHRAGTGCHRPLHATSHNIKHQISAGHQLRRSYNRMGTTTNGTLVAP